MVPVKGKPNGHGGGDDEKTARKRKSRSGARFIDDLFDVMEEEDEDEDDIDSSDFSGYDSEMFEDGSMLKASHVPYIKDEFDRMMEANEHGFSFITHAENGHGHKNSIVREISMPASTKDPAFSKVKCMGKEKVTDGGGNRSGHGGGDDNKMGRKQKSSNNALFIDNIADVEDENEEEEEDSTDFSDYDSEEEISEDEFDRMTEARCKPGSRFTTDAQDGSDHNNTTDTEIFEDRPTFWKVKCAVGRERYSALCLKYADVTSFGNKVQIVSACALDHLKGFIIIEAEEADDVYEACRSFSTIYSSEITPFPSDEISRLLSILESPYSEDETKCLGHVWVDLGQGLNVSTDQEAEDFWTRIANRYNSCRPVNTIERAGQQLRMHWSQVHTSINVFNRIYNKLEKDKQTMAHEEYFSIEKAHFKHQNTWEAVRRHTAMFAPVDGGVHASKRNKTNVDGSDSTAPSPEEGAKAKGKKKAFDANKENDKLGTITKVGHNGNVMSMKTAYDITLKDTSKMTPEQLATHNQWVDLIKRTFGL